MAPSLSSGSSLITGRDSALSGRPQGWLVLALASALVTVSVACGPTAPVVPSASSAAAIPTATPGAAIPTATPAADDHTVSAVEVTPGALLLTGAIETGALVAVARNAAGRELEAEATWTSSDPAVASVDGDGSVRATAAIGTALVTATVAGIESPSVYVTVAQPVAGAVLIEDSHIVGGPTILDPAAEPEAENPYEVLLRGAPGIEPGELLINTGGLSVAGRVVSNQAEGSDTRVRLVVVPPTELFTDFEFNDSVELSEGPFEVPADLAAAYEVVQDGSTFDFRPRSAAGTPRIMLAGQAQGTRALPPFKDCETTIGTGSEQPLPLTVSAPPAFTLGISGDVTREASPQGTKLTLSGSPTFNFTSVLEIRSAFEAKVECKLTLVTRKFRVPGWAGLFFGGDVEFGVGFEIGGKVTLFAAKVGGSAELKATVQGTLDCPIGGSCALTGDVSSTTDLTPVLQTPALAQAQFEPTVNLFGFVSLAAGNADIEQLQFKAIEIKAGAELGAALSLEALQIDNTDASRGRSKYELAFKGEVGPGVKLGGFLQYLGLSQVVPLKLTAELPLGQSPTGTVSADRGQYQPGEQARVDVKLAADSTVFPNGGIYNVERVVVLRKQGASTEVLAEQVATDDQTEFSLSFQSPGLLRANEIFAFVVTRLLPIEFLPRLEIGAAAASAAVAAVVMYGSDSGVPAATLAAEQLTLQNPGFRYTIAGGGEADGFQRFCFGETDAVLAERPISDEETQLCASHGVRWAAFALGYYDTDKAATNPALAALVDYFTP